MIDRAIRRMLLGAVSLGVVVFTGACGDDTEGQTSAAQTTVAMTMTTTSPTSGSTDDTGADTTTATPTSTSESEAGSADASGEVTTGGGGAVPCDPPMAPFLMPEGTLVAAIQLDFDAGTCRASSSPGDAPQVVFEVQPSGLIDALLFGMEIVDVSSGHIFMDPPTADSEVADLASDLPLRFDAVRIDDGTPVTITFEVFSTGPTLLDVRVEYG